MAWYSLLVPLTTTNQPTLLCLCCGNGFHISPKQTGWLHQSLNRFFLVYGKNNSLFPVVILTGGSFHTLVYFAGHKLLLSCSSGECLYIFVSKRATFVVRNIRCSKLWPWQLVLKFWQRIRWACILHTCNNTAFISFYPLTAVVISLSIIHLFIWLFIRKCISLPS